MSAISELRSLSVPERLQLVEDLWNSIVEDQELLKDSPAVITEVRARKARFLASPDSGVSWDETKARIRSGRA